VQRLAEALIDELLEGWRVAGPRPGFVTKPNRLSVKGESLSGAEVASLKPRDSIIVDGYRSRVIEVQRKGSEVTLVYVKGASSFGAERFLVVNYNDSVTAVQLFGHAYLESATPGMKNAMKRSLEAKFVCKKCEAPIPKYPGRYPGKCPDCGGKLEEPSSDYVKMWRTPMANAKKRDED